MCLLSIRLGAGVRVIGVFTISDGILYGYGPEECEEETACLVIPEHEREKVLTEYHDAPTTGHFEVERSRLSEVEVLQAWDETDYHHVLEDMHRLPYKSDYSKPVGLLQTRATIASLKSFE